ncbi:MAG: Ribonuclease [Actinomycetota bacterium]|jgi:ribonuclease P protein component
MLADPSLEAAFVAFAIGRAAGPAVERNRVRRRLREILRSADVAPGLYLFGLTTVARETSFDGLRTAVRNVLARSASSSSTGV